MATVREYMDPDPVTVSPGASLEEVARTMGETELPAVPVVDGDGRVVGIVREDDLVIGDEEGDLHLPAYLELFGSLIPLPGYGRFNERLKKAVAATA